VPWPWPLPETEVAGERECSAMVGEKYRPRIINHSAAENPGKSLSDETQFQGRVMALGRRY
jgi:hypothetical protein